MWIHVDIWVQSIKGVRVGIFCDSDIFISRRKRKAHKIRIPTINSEGTSSESLCYDIGKYLKGGEKK